MADVSAAVSWRKTVIVSILQRSFSPPAIAPSGQWLFPCLPPKPTIINYVPGKGTSGHAVNHSAGRWAPLWVSEWVIVDLTGFSTFGLQGIRWNPGRCGVLAISVYIAVGVIADAVVRAEKRTGRPGEAAHCLCETIASADQPQGFPRWRMANSGGCACLGLALIRINLIIYHPPRLGNWWRWCIIYWTACRSRRLVWSVYSIEIIF